MRIFRNLLIVWLLMLSIGPTQAEIPLNVGVMSYRPKEVEAVQWQPLARHLEASLGRNIRMMYLTRPDLDKAVSEKAVDVVIANPAAIILYQHRDALSMPLASLIWQEGAYQLASFGGVIFTRADENNVGIFSLADIARLDDHRIAAVGMESFGGFLMQVYEMKKAGLPLPDKAKVLETGRPQDAVIDAVLSGRADVGFVRTGVLESMVRSGELNMAQVRIVNQQIQPDFPYALSTTLYPEWTVATAKHMSKDFASRIAIALLSMPHEGDIARTSGLHGFSSPLDYDSVGQMLREIRAPPFDAAPDFSVSDVWNKYPVWITGLYLLALLLAGFVAGLMIQNRRVQQERERFRTLFKASPDPIVLVADGRYLDCNEAALKILGYTSRQQLLEHPVGGMAPQYPPNGRASRDVIEQMSQVAFAGDSLQYDWTNLTADGHEASFSCHLNRITLDGKPVLMIVAHDITRRRKNEEELRKTHELLTLAQQAVESPRILRRLQVLREWSHEESKQVFPGSSRARSTDGARASERLPVAVGSHRIDRTENRLRSADAA